MSEDDKEYNPTNAEKKVLEAMKDPNNYTVSITEFCKNAGVGRNTYYNMLKKPGFIKKKNEIYNKMFENFVPEVKKACVKYAINNAKNFQDRKIILEMTGEYSPKVDNHVQIDNPYKNLSTEQLENLAKFGNKDDENE